MNRLRIGYALALLALIVTSVPSIAEPAETISYTLEKPGRVSAALYAPSGRLVRTLLRARQQEAGRHTLRWDGLDRHGHPQEPGTYTVRLLRKDPFKAEYLMSIGAGDPERQLLEKWAGNHHGAGCVALADEAMYVGSSTAENAQALLKQSTGGERIWNKQGENKTGSHTRGSGRMRTITVVRFPSRSATMFCRTHSRPGGRARWKSRSRKRSGFPCMLVVVSNSGSMAGS